MQAREEVDTPEPSDESDIEVGSTLVFGGILFYVVEAIFKFSHPCRILLVSQDHPKRRGRSQCRRDQKLSWNMKMSQNHSQEINFSHSCGNVRTMWKKHSFNFLIFNILLHYELVIDIVGSMYFNLKFTRMLAHLSSSSYAAGIT